MKKKYPAIRVYALCWGISMLLHIVVPLLFFLWHTGNLSFLSAIHVAQSEDIDISELMPPEYLADPQPITISDRSVLVDHGGRDAAQRELFDAFAKTGGLVGSISKLAEGPKVRFGHTVIAKYCSYYRSGFIGHYQTAEGLDVFILDGRNDPRFGKLLMHVPDLDMLRGLTQHGSRYIYTYSNTLLGEKPIAGSVMFMGDGDKIFRLMWLPKKGKAKYPTRLLYFK